VEVEGVLSEPLLDHLLDLHEGQREAVIALGFELFRAPRSAVHCGRAAWRVHPPARSMSRA